MLRSFGPPRQLALPMLRRHRLLWTVSQLTHCKSRARASPCLWLTSTLRCEWTSSQLSPKRCVASLPSLLPPSFAASRSCTNSVMVRQPHLHTRQSSHYAVHAPTLSRDLQLGLCVPGEPAKDGQEGKETAGTGPLFVCEQGAAGLRLVVCASVSPRCCSVLCCAVL